MTDSSSAADQNKEPTLTDDVGELLTLVRSHSRRLSRVKKLLSKVDKKEPRAGDYETWLEVHQGLEGYEIAIDEVDQRRQSVVERMGKQLTRLRVKARMTFLTKLDMLAGAKDLSVEKISESPLVLYLEPLTFEVDFDGGGVRLLYGHELIDDTLSINASTLIDAHAKYLAQLKKLAIPSEDFFDLLFDAYQTVLARTHGEEESRVDLVDVLVPLAMLRADDKSLRKKGIHALEPFTRYQLAWQLAQLRRDGLLEKEGRRLDLGAATGGSTRDKSDVLYIPVGAKSGQYYGSIRFNSTN